MYISQLPMFRLKVLTKHRITQVSHPHTVTQCVSHTSDLEDPRSKMNWMILPESEALQLLWLVRYSNLRAKSSTLLPTDQKETEKKKLFKCHLIRSYGVPVAGLYKQSHRIESSGQSVRELQASRLDVEMGRGVVGKIHSSCWPKRRTDPLICRDRNSSRCPKWHRPQTVPSESVNN